MFGNSSNLFNSTSSVKDLRDSPIVCEHCGLRYSDLVSKYTHQLYYCMGRDLSLEASLLRIRNNLSMKTSLPPQSYLNRLGSLMTRKYPLYSMFEDEERTNSVKGFYVDNDSSGYESTKLPVRYIHKFKFSPISIK